MKKSPSEIGCSVPREDVARYVAREVTDALNRVCADLGRDDEFAVAASRRVLENVEW